MRFYGDVAYEHPIRTVIVIALLMPLHTNIHACIAFYLYKWTKDGWPWH